MAPRRLLYLIAEDWLFRSHFLERAKGALREGYDVAVLTRRGVDSRALEEAGLRVLAMDFERRGLHPLREVHALRQIIAAYRQERPDLVHQVALKPILYGTIAARIAGIRHIVNAPIGMGFVFTSRKPLALLLRPLVRFALKRLLNPRGSRVVFENPEDHGDLVRRGYVRAGDAMLVPGAGVDLEAFHPRPPPPGPPVVVLAARMLQSKGVREFVEAAAALRARGVQARFWLAGAPDPGNPESIAEDQLRRWSDSGVVEWLGFRPDMAEVYAQAHMACLPSYREGLPKALLEAMAAGLPVVSTDVVGCRYAVEEGVTGLLAPARDAAALADAIARLIADPGLRSRFGAAGRLRAEALFGSPAIVAQTLRLYHELAASGAS